MQKLQEKKGDIWQKNEDRILCIEEYNLKPQTSRHEGSWKLVSTVTVDRCHNGPGRLPWPCLLIKTTMRSKHGGVSHSYTHANTHTCVRQPQALSSLAWRQEIAAVSPSHSLTHARTHTSTYTHTRTNTHSKWGECCADGALTSHRMFACLCTALISSVLHCYCSPEAAVWVWHLPGKEGGGEGLTEQTGRWSEWDNSSPFTFSENAFMISRLHLCSSQFVLDQFHMLISTAGCNYGN